MKPEYCSHERLVYIGRQSGFGYASDFDLGECLSCRGSMVINEKHYEPEGVWMEREGSEGIFWPVLRMRKTGL